MSAPTRGAAHPSTTVSLAHTKGSDDLIRSLNEALARAKDDGPAIVHAPVTPREVRKKANLTQAQMAPLMDMSLSGYRKREQGTLRVVHRRVARFGARAQRLVAEIECGAAGAGVPACAEDMNGLHGPIGCLDTRKGREGFRSA